VERCSLVANMTLATHVQATAVALDILEAIAYSSDEIGVSAIAAELGLAKSAVFRHLQTFVDRGYVSRTSSSRYRLGAKIQVLARLRPQGDHLLAAAGEVISELRDSLDETIVLSIPEPRGARVVATALRNATLELGVKLGSLLPYDSSAQGKVLAAGAEPERKWKATVRAERGVSRAKHQGWLESSGEVMPGVNAIAAPICDAEGKCIAAIAVVGLFPLSSKAKVSKYASALRGAAERIGLKLGRRTEAVHHANKPRVPVRDGHRR
jgi:IclR family transcriptional regulator, KDG regulon repressor